MERKLMFGVSLFFALYVGVVAAAFVADAFSKVHAQFEQVQQ